MGNKPLIAKAQNFAKSKARKEISRETYQAMEALIHNLNTMHSRAGAQIPFSSINYGTDTSPEGRLVIKNLLLAAEAGLGNGETPIFPIHIFKVKEGVNYNPGDPNYDLFQLACRVSAKRLFPNFSFLDAPYNLKYYKPGRPETEIAYMGCRTRVIGNVYDPSQEIVNGRGNLSFTTINLPRLGLKHRNDLPAFYEDLDAKIAMVVEQLLERFEIQAKKKVKNFPFLMGQHLWLDSHKLNDNDEIREVIKHGTLFHGFHWLGRVLKSPYRGTPWRIGACAKLQVWRLSHMRQRMIEVSQSLKLTTLLATPAEGTAGRFVKMDREIFGNIPGVTDGSTIPIVSIFPYIIKSVLLTRLDWKPLSRIDQCRSYHLYRIGWGSLTISCL